VTTDQAPTTPEARYNAIAQTGVEAADAIACSTMTVFDLRDSQRELAKQITAFETYAMGQVVAELGDTRSNETTRETMRDARLADHMPYHELLRDAVVKRREIAEAEATHEAIKMKERWARLDAEFLIATFR